MMAAAIQKHGKALLLPLSDDELVGPRNSGSSEGDRFEHTAFREAGGELDRELRWTERSSQSFVVFTRSVYHSNFIAHRDETPLY